MLVSQHYGLVFNHIPDQGQHVVTSQTHSIPPEIERANYTFSHATPLMAFRDPLPETPFSPNTCPNEMPRPFLTIHSSTYSSPTVVVGSTITISARGVATGPVP